MATAYDKPVENKLIDTYVPLPFQEMMQQASLLRDTYDKNLEKLEAGRTTLANVEAYGTGAKSELDAITKQYEATADQLAQGDLTSYDSKRLASGVVSKLANDPTLKDIVVQSAAIKDAQKRHQAMAASPNYKDYYAADYRAAMDKYDKEGTKAGVDFNNISFFTPVNVKEDIEKKFFDDIKANLDASANKNDPDWITKTKGVTSKAIYDQAQTNLGQYLDNKQVQLDLKNATNTPEKVEDLNAEFSLRLKNQFPTKTDEELTAEAAKYNDAEKYAFNRLLSTGNEFIYNEKDITPNQVKQHKEDMRIKTWAAMLPYNQENNTNTRTQDAVASVATLIQKNNGQAINLNYGNELTGKVSDVFFKTPTADYKGYQTRGTFKTIGGFGVPTAEIKEFTPTNLTVTPMSANGAMSATGGGTAWVSEETAKKYWEKIGESKYKDDPTEWKNFIKLSMEKNQKLTEQTNVSTSDSEYAEVKTSRQEILYGLPVTSESSIDKVQYNDLVRSELADLSGKDAKSVGAN